MSSRLRFVLTLALLIASIAVAPEMAAHRVAAAQAGPALSVDASAGRHPISADIYGMNYADPALAQELRMPVDRWGGDETSRYNWQNNFSNTGLDWYFENIYQNQTADQFVAADRAHGTKSLVSVPLIGYVSKDSPRDHPYNCGFRTDLYGSQQASDPWDARCGNGVRADGTNVTGNDPLDTSIAIDQTWDQQWVQHFITQFGSAADGGVALYALDNEPVLWNSTHRDVHPSPVSYDELTTRGTTYAAALKGADPTAQVVGPSDWGYPAYFDTNVPGDRAAHGNIALGRWYLQQFRAAAQQHGARLLDYFDEHFYPQGAGVTLKPAGTTATQALRLRSTRALWDPTYTDESWINAPIALIPTFRGWIASDYPGTKLAITEYNWGGLESINGALAEADVLGIFGREGVDLAAIWDPPTSGQPGAYAFRMYRNYDGHGGSFGDVAIEATSADQGTLAVYGASRTSDGALTLMVVNKTGGDLTSALTLSHFQGTASAQLYTYSAANLTAIVRGADVPVGQGGFTATYPANSITLIVIPPLPLPSVTSLSPVSGPMAGGTVVTIHGANFAAGGTVIFGATAPVAATVVNDTTLTATTPPAASPGPVNIVVTTPTGPSVPFPGFTYVPPNPLPTSDRSAPTTMPSPTTSLPAPRAGPASGSPPNPIPAHR